MDNALCWLNFSLSLCKPLHAWLSDCRLGGSRRKSLLGRMTLPCIAGLQTTQVVGQVVFGGCRLMMSTLSRDGDKTLQRGKDRLIIETKWQGSEAETARKS